MRSYRAVRVQAVLAVGVGHPNPVVAGGVEQAAGAVDDFGVDVDGGDLPAGCDEVGQQGGVEPARADLQHPHPGAQIGLFGHHGVRLRRGDRGDRRPVRVAAGDHRVERPVDDVGGGIGQEQMPRHRPERLGHRRRGDLAVLAQRRHQLLAQLHGLVGVDHRRPSSTAGHAAVPSPVATAAEGVPERWWIVRAPLPPPLRAPSAGMRVGAGGERVSTAS